MLNAERWTMPDGEPVAGIRGEGFVERRHPHTVLHELMLSGALHFGTARMSVAGGRGFVPFCTDDPMVRPFTTYPANHQLSQLMVGVQFLAAAAIRERAAIEVQGITRWHIPSAQLARSVRIRNRAHSTLFAEVEYAHSSPLLRPVLLDPHDVIGADHAAFLIGGIRLGGGAMSTRVGRYGAGAAGAGTDVDLIMGHEQ